jgi:hypothetical protein
VGQRTEERPTVTAGSSGRGAARVRAALPFLPVLLLAGAIAYDCLTPVDFTAGPLFTAAPLVASSLYSLRGTALTALATVLAAAALHAGYGVVSNVRTHTQLVTIATVAVLAVLLNVLVRRTGARLASVRQIAEAAQHAVMPQPPERLAGLDIAACYEAAQDGAAIGGDLYAVQDSPHGVRLVVGDVRGKGVSAVSVVAVVIGAFREAAEQEATLGAVAQRLERALAREAGRRRDLDSFEGSPPPSSPRSRTATPSSASSTAATRPRCSCTTTAGCACSNHASPRSRWAWASWAGGPNARTRPHCRTAPPFSSTPTGSPKPATGTASSTTPPPGSPAVPSPGRTSC